ncbi:nucleotide exchange factor GrpE [Patescibacteria group bacterium]|nr:nucleotide exchange factor GrpE [Patescibacteria group bacterium]
MPHKPKKDEDNQPEPECQECRVCNEKWQRALADLENLRKRHELEKAQWIQYGLAKLLEELLPVVDNFYRATDHIPEDQRNSPWVTGIQYIQKNLLDVLEREGVKEIAVQPGDRFNPGRHEAIDTVETDEMEEDRIVEVKNKGYLLHERVLRPVQVTVSKSKTTKE